MQSRLLRVWECCVAAPRLARLSERKNVSLKAQGRVYHHHGLASVTKGFGAPQLLGTPRAGNRASVSAASDASAREVGNQSDDDI